MAENQNINVMHITIIEGLTSEINGHIEALTPKTYKLQTVKDALCKGLAEWQANELRKARRAFE